MDGVGTKPRFIPEKHLPAVGLGLPRDGWICLAPPLLDRLGIALIRALQWFLRRQIELGEQFPNRGQTKPDAEFALDQVSHYPSRP